MNQKKKIMILDDNREFVILLKNYINTQKDMEVVTYAYDGTNAINLIKKTNPDVLLLDVVMPEKSGLTILKEISKELEFKMPLVFIMSSISHVKIIQNAISLGAMYYFIKPFNIKKFIDRVRDLMIPYNSIIALNTKFSSKKSIEFENINIK
ncbi:MAG: response regulator [Clostridia bacterium]|nr:response regulator [Clostridia bacterium]MDD4386302.1 response regulator [Clostridia bacterium]